MYQGCKNFWFSHFQFSQKNEIFRKCLNFKIKLTKEKNFWFSLSEFFYVFSIFVCDFRQNYLFSLHSWYVCCVVSTPHAINYDNMYFKWLSLHSNETHKIHFSLFLPLCVSPTKCISPTHTVSRKLPPPDPLIKIHFLPAGGDGIRSNREIFPFSTLSSLFISLFFHSKTLLLLHSLRFPQKTFLKLFNIFSTNFDNHCFA